MINTLYYGSMGVVGSVLLQLNSQFIRDEITAWITMLGSVAITTVTISIQVYHLIRDRDKDLKRNKKNKKKKNKKKGKKR